MMDMVIWLDVNMINVMKLGRENIKILQELDFYLFYEVWVLELGGSYINILSSVLGPSHEIEIILGGTDRWDTEN